MSLTDCANLILRLPASGGLLFPPGKSRQKRAQGFAPRPLRGKSSLRWLGVAFVDYGCYQSRARTGQTSFSFGPYRGVGSAQWQGCSYGGSLLHSNPRVSTKADGLVIPLLQSAGLTETDAGLKPGSSHFCGSDCGWRRAEGSRASVRDTASAISRRGPGASPWFPLVTFPKGKVTPPGGRPPE